MYYSSLAGRANTHLPDGFRPAHQLCFVVHDIMVQLLASGRRASIFNRSIKFRDDADRLAFEQAEDVFVWLEQSRRFEERADLLATTAFPAVLGDMLHCFYEALEASRKGKLGITFMLVRKPLQESLFLLESVLIDRRGFANVLESGFTRGVRSRNAGSNSGIRAS